MRRDRRLGIGADASASVKGFGSCSPAGKADLCRTAQDHREEWPQGRRAMASGDEGWTSRTRMPRAPEAQSELMQLEAWFPGGASLCPGQMQDMGTFYIFLPI